MIISRAEELWAVHRELVEAHRDWVREFRNVGSTLRYEDLLPIALRLDQALARFVRASAPFTEM